MSHRANDETARCCSTTNGASPTAPGLRSRTDPWPSASQAWERLLGTEIIEGRARARPASPDPGTSRVTVPALPVGRLA